MRILKFYADWCGPCKALSVQFKGIELPVGTKLVEIDIDKDRENTQKYSVRGVPTMVVLDRQNNEVTRKTGTFLSRKELREWVEANCPPEEPEVLTPPSDPV